ncbi:MAG TPA: hypothetical protein VFU15_17395 [Bacteroidia bacterium]|nr:hypothetical protein [Bacteroidia bacterium]
MRASPGISMKKYFPFFFAAFVFTSCLDGIPISPDDTGSAQAADTAKKDMPGPVPKEVRKGKVSSWGFDPDSCVNDLVLGSRSSFEKWWQKCGERSQRSDNNIYSSAGHIVRHHAQGPPGEKIGENTYGVSWLNPSGNEQLDVYVYDDENGNETPYMLALQRPGSGSVIMPQGDTVYARDRHFMTGYGIYLGMSSYFVQSVYTDQPMMEWMTGDTLYLQYHPQQKDAKYYHYYSWKDYTATYKFTDDRLCRIEYYVSPSAFRKPE